MFISVSIDIPDVINISPEIAALSPDKKHFLPLSSNNTLPPASLIDALGTKNLNIFIFYFFQCIHNISFLSS